MKFQPLPNSDLQFKLIQHPKVKLIHYPTEPEPDDEDDKDTGSQVSVDPVLTTVGHIRELAKIVDDPKAVKELEETRSLREAILCCELLVKNDIARAFAWCDIGIEKLTSQVS